MNFAPKVWLRFNTSLTYFDLKLFYLSTDQFTDFCTSVSWRRNQKYFTNNFADQTNRDYLVIGFAVNAGNKEKNQLIADQIESFCKQAKIEFVGGFMDSIFHDDDGARSATT